MQLQITSVELYKLRIPLKQPFVISLGTQHDADNVLVIIRTNKGISGYGECSPYMSINGESIDTCFIVGQYLAGLLIGKDPLRIEECVFAMDRLITRNENIKSAFDMALYDIAAQHADLPLYKFLGGEKNKIISTDMTVGLGSPEKMATEATEYKSAGFPSIKVKLGTTTEEDVARIKAIRDAIGNELPLRIDANQGWNVETAIATLQALAPYDIEHCEEPIARWNYMALPEVRKNSPIKIMSDESCFDEHDAERLAKLNACDYFNVKLGKSGGIWHALKIVEVAKANNLKLQVGCFMESRLAITTLVHFAYSSDLIIHYDLDTPLMLKEDPVVGGMVFKENGIVEIDEAVGIGATVDDEYLKKCDKVII
ncbi:dipeptide epimerase [Lacibacter sp. H375]|uniref:mandelate racemase/muconate lactonizing enzyme family protein n=1 Tax=Lacibacter sp. H375 TaxID=3133424 RepID=UPI0030BA915D